MAAILSRGRWVKMPARYQHKMSLNFALSNLPAANELVNCCLIMPYGDIDLGQHWPLNQCWLIIKGVLWHSLQSNFSRIAHELNNPGASELILLLTTFWTCFQGWGQFRFCNSNSNSNSGISRFYNSNSNSNSRAYNSNSNSNSRSSIPIPIPIPVTRWNQYAASIHIDIIIARLMVQYGENTNNIMNKTQREYQ